MTPTRIKKTNMFSSIYIYMHIYIHTLVGLSGNVTGAQKPKKLVKHATERPSLMTGA